MINATEFFRPAEFDSPDAPGSGYYLDPDLYDALNLIREKCGFRFKVNSGVRTKAYNALPRIGGKPTSDHLIHTDGFGHGVDIQILSGAKRYAILNWALFFGVRRIGIGKTFVHLGNWKSNPQGVIWLY